MAKKKTTYFTSEVRITFTGKTTIDENGNKETVDLISKTAVALIRAIKHTVKDLEIVPEQNTTYSDKPIKVEVTKNELQP